MVSPGPLVTPPEEPYASVVLRPRGDLPTPIRLIGWFETAVGVLAMVTGLAAAGAAAPLFLISGIISTTIGFGLLSGKLWAYYAAVVLSALNLVSLVILFLRGARAFFPALVVNALILYLLLSPDIRGWAASLRKPRPPVA